MSKLRLQTNYHPFLLYRHRQVLNSKHSIVKQAVRSFGALLYYIYLHNVLYTGHWDFKNCALQSMWVAHDSQRSKNRQQKT